MLLTEAKGVVQLTVLETAYALPGGQHATTQLTVNVKNGMDQDIRV